MARARREITDPVKRRNHEKSLERRRKKHQEFKKMKAAVQAAEGDADFDTLVDAERKRLGHVEKQQSKAAKHSPKTITAARENLTLAFDLMGGVPALVVWGKANPTEFYRLWARLIPKESVEISANLPLEDLLRKLSTKESMSVGEAAYQVGTDMMNDARMKVIEHDKQNPDFQDPYESNDEEAI